MAGSISTRDYLSELLSVQCEQAEKTAAKLAATGLSEEGQRRIEGLRGALRDAVELWRVLPEENAGGEARGNRIGA